MRRVALQRRALLVGLTRALSMHRQTRADPSPKKALKVVMNGGHPGDPEYGCDGTIARYAQLGHPDYHPVSESRRKSSVGPQRVRCGTKATDSVCRRSWKPVTLLGQVRSSCLNAMATQSSTRRITKVSPSCWHGWSRMSCSLNGRSIITRITVGFRHWTLEAWTGSDARWPSTTMRSPMVRTRRCSRLRTISTLPRRSRSSARHAPLTPRKIWTVTTRSNPRLPSSAASRRVVVGRKASPATFNRRGCCLHRATTRIISSVWDKARVLRRDQVNCVNIACTVKTSRL